MSHHTSTVRRRLGVGALTCVAAFSLGAAGTLSADAATTARGTHAGPGSRSAMAPNPQGAVSPTAQPMTTSADATFTRQQILDRAQYWITQKVPYNMGGTASAPGTPTGPYRTDCSGFVSMAWGLGTSTNTQGIPTYATQIAVADLRPGDVVDYNSTKDPVRGSHVVMFVGWADAAHTEYVIREESASYGATERTVPYPYDKGMDGSGSWIPYRYNNVQEVSSAFRVAFAGSSTPTLYTYDSATGAAALGQGMLAGTSPAITRVPSGYESAFVANTGNLVLYGDALKGNTNQPVAAGSSPAITRTSDGHLVAAYRAASNGALRLWVDGTIVDTAQGVRANTSPAIAAGPNGTYRVAFQASSGTLFTYDSTTGPANTGNGMATTSSPAITAVNGGYEMAAIINTGELITLGPLGNRRTAQGAQTGTSPDIAASPDGTGFRVAFQANTGYLYTYDSTTGPANTGNGLATDASPAITTVAGGYEMAARINTGALIVLGNTTNSNTAQGITAHTNPALP